MPGDELLQHLPCALIRFDDGGRIADANPAARELLGIASEEGGEHFLTLHAWSKARGRKEVLEIIEAVIDALEAAPPQPSGHVLVNLMAERIEVRFDDDLDGYHGLVRYRAVTEPAN